MDLVQYSHIKLSAKRGNETTRSERDREIDFVYMVQLRQAGASWAEITELINAERPYYTTEKGNRDLYNKRLVDATVKASADDAAEDSRTELLNELDWMYAQVIAKWQKLKNVDYVEEISGLLKSGDDETEEFDENGELIVKGKKYSKKKIGLNEQHQAKYVDLALKIIEMKAKMTGAMAIEKHEISIVDLLKGKVLDDGGKAKGVKISSEEDLTRMYADPQFSFEEIQIIPDEFRDEEE